MVRGDTLSFSAKFEGLATAFSAASFTVRKTPTDETAVFQKTLSDGITAAGDDIYLVRIAPEDTENVACGKYYYDFEVRTDSDVYTVMLGLLTIEQDITR